MKTTSCLHIFVVAATMTAIACSEPDETEEPKPRRSQASVKNVPPQNNLTPIPVSKFYTDVTTWTQTDSTNFIGLVSSYLTYLGHGRNCTEFTMIVRF